MSYVEFKKQRNESDSELAGELKTLLISFCEIENPDYNDFV